MLKTIICFTPFLICLLWCISFLLQYKRNDSAKRHLTLFLATCVVLYFCHALYFTTGLTEWMDSLWTLCSLSVYPLFYYYIRHLTNTKDPDRRLLWWLMPGVVIAIAKMVFPGDAADVARKVLNMTQIITVCVLGFRRLRQFDKELADVYADAEGKDTSAVKALLLCFVLLSLSSVIANFLGREYFSEGTWQIAVIAIPFTALLYACGFIGFTRDFTAEQYATDSVSNEPETTSAPLAKSQEEVELAGRIDELMCERRFFLTQDIKIGDLSKELGVCRTYVSSCINNVSGMSFSDYINKQRIEYAKTLLSRRDVSKLAEIAEESGYTNEQSFYRNFRKFEGNTPAEWMKRNSM